MSIKIVRSLDQEKPSLVMCIYSKGGVGKSTLAATAPRPIFIDAEEGTKGFKVRGIDVPVVHVKTWDEVNEAWRMLKDSTDYDTIIIDPIDQFLDLLIEQVRGGGQMNLKLWGEVKDRMSRFTRLTKNSGKHCLFVAHEDKDKDEEKQLRKPLLKANLSETLVNLCDVVGYLQIGSSDERSLCVQPKPGFEAKDRFAVLGDIIKVPDLSKFNANTVAVPGTIASIVASIHALYDEPPFKDIEKPKSEHAKKMEQGIKDAKPIQ